MGARGTSKHQSISCCVRISEGVLIRDLPIGEDGLAAATNRSLNLRGKVNGRNDVGTSKHTIPCQSGLAHVIERVVLRPEITFEPANFGFPDGHAAFANDFKSYASRALKGEQRKWARHGSALYLRSPDAVANALCYVIEEQGEHGRIFRKPKRRRSGLLV